ncbi:MAG: NAD(P)H-hydrate dehydratase, partial [Anaerolineae bacterium]
GTGFRGRAEGSLAKAIEKANHVKLPIIAIDIPSGVDGNTGDVGSVAINAALTVYLGLPKTGFFWGEGWNHVGLLRRADFGLPQEFVDQAKPQAHLVDSATLSNLLPPLKRNRHKYQAGYTLAFAGSVEMPGAAILSTSAAMRSGCGILRLFHPVDAASALSFSSVEVIKEGWDLKHLARILEESRRASSLLMGPGMGRGPLVQKALKKLLSTLSLPCILDADALYFLSEHPDTILPEKTVLTPHHQEMRRLLPQKDVTRETCQAFVDEKKVTLVLKGAPTWIFCPSELPLIIPRGDPGMATAGTGDVLAGMIAALLAQKLGSKEAAALAVFLHALAGEIAASEKTSYCLVASDLLDYLPRAFSHLKHKS